MAASNSNSKFSGEQTELLQSELNDGDLDRYADVANKLADAAGDVIRNYFRKKFEILDKDDLSKFLLQFVLDIDAFIYVGIHF